MAAEHAHKPIGSPRPHHRPAHPGPLAADTETGFARFFVPALLALALTTAALAWESWDAETPRAGVIAGLSF